MELLRNKGVEVCIYEPTLAVNVYNDYPVVADFAEFITICDVIVANRLSEELLDVKDKVYSRDIYSRD
jgi:UDPglucose 6-dehydrogenase